MPEYIMDQWLDDYEGVWWKHVGKQKLDAAIWKRGPDNYEWIVWRKDNARSLWKRIKEGYEFTYDDAIEAADLWLANNPYPLD
jgi:hypothetical protein